jgi:hypothetical protein
MNKKKIVLPILALVLAIVALAMLVISPAYLGTEAYGIGTETALSAKIFALLSRLNYGITDGLRQMILLKNGALFSAVFLLAFAALLVFWILDLVLLIKRSHKSSIFTNVSFVISSCLSFAILLVAFAKNVMVVGVATTGDGSAYFDLFGYVASYGITKITTILLAILPYVIALAGYVFSLVMVIGDTKELVALGKKKPVVSSKSAAEETKAAVPANKEDELKKVQDDELDSVENELITSDELRQIIREEMRIQSSTEHGGVKIEEVRTVIAQELDKRFAALALSVAEKNVEAPVAPTANAPISQEAPAVSAVEAAPVLEKKVEETPHAEAVAPALAVAPSAAASVAEIKVPKKIIRVPFPTRMNDAEKELKNNYNELKAEALSYGLKSRLSNSGDTFRLHTKAYLKITIAGKGLKLYYALDPKAYADSPIPVKDAGKKNLYKEIPAVFKVKSPLSVKRAKQLIAEVCAKDQLVQDKIEPNNFAAEMKFYKPQNGGDDNSEKDE